MTNTVLIKRSDVANAVPAPGNLLAGELAINSVDGNLFYKNSGNTVTVIASNKFLSVSGNVTANNGQFTNIVNVASYTGAVVSVTGNIIAGGNGAVNCINGNDGKEVWKASIPVDSNYVVYSFTPSVIDDDGAVLGSYTRNESLPVQKYESGLFEISLNA
jgi:outer membrane protein assembly factor BamB